MTSHFSNQRTATETTLHFARKLEGRHSFGLDERSDPRRQPTPRRARSGQFFLDCARCGRTIFEDGSGSAGDGPCA